MDEFPELSKKGGNHNDDGGSGQTSKSKMLIRLVGAGFFLVAGLMLFGDFLKARHDQASISAGDWIWVVVLAVIGVWILVKTDSLADRLDEWLEQ